MKNFYSHGKLLISGEYVVLDGATALALPTKYGQNLEVNKIDPPVLRWKSVDHEGGTWLEQEFKIADLDSSKVPDEYRQNEVSKMLFLTLSLAAELDRGVLKTTGGYEITSKTDFPAHWGLGTSSTLIANLSKWLEIDPYELLKGTFGGSGYDIAVAMTGTAITFEKQDLENSVLKTTFDPPFKEELFFVHLNQKQNSRESIKYYRQCRKENIEPVIEKISALTHRIITCTDLLDFKLLLEIHENLISQLIGLTKVKSRLFPDYEGAIKSLGGWGGDFVLVTGTSKDMDYFRQKGYQTIIPYSKMIL